MMFRRTYFVLILLPFMQGLRAQDFHLSMYETAPLFLNPAMTGLIETKMRAHLHFRNQWNSVAYKPYTTALASLDVPKGKWGFGGQITNMRAGIGNYNVLQLLGSTSYAVYLDAPKKHSLSLGLQAGFTQKHLEYPILTFDSQWTSANGGSFDNSLSTNENFQGRSQFQEAVNFGMLYYYGQHQNRLNPFFGFSAFNITRPKESFIGSNNRLPVRYYFHPGVRVNVSELFYFIPKVLIYLQTKTVQETYALDAGYYFKGEKFYALGGFMYRHQDASVIHLGIKKDNIMFKFAYDFNVSTLRGLSKSRGAYEISITWYGKKEKTNEIKNCPRL
ncbi:MAG TPA: PorP/SprF family type IX secretion system membrane protein [Bacteroidia bacterium]|nr:PorP/SprF family type IX secretion system membrane protein [Bacteroidia bacterium]